MTMNNVIKKAEYWRSGDIYSIFTSQLFLKLKEKIDASVYVANHDDTLVVCINKGPISYRYEITNFGNKLLGGLDTNTVVNTILADYKVFLMKIFFYDYRR